MINIGNAKELAETLFSLNKTLGAIQSQCDALAGATERLDMRCRELEKSIIHLEADLKVSASETKASAISIATETASKLVSSVHGPLVSEVAELKSKINAVKTNLADAAIPQIGKPGGAVGNGLDSESATG